MSEQERIQALLQAGKITPQEAELLLSALEESENEPDPAQKLFQPEAPLGLLGTGQAYRRQA